MPKQVHSIDFSEDMVEVCKECQLRAIRLERRRLAKYERYHSDEAFRAKLVTESRERYGKDKEREDPRQVLLEHMEEGRHPQTERRTAQKVPCSGIPFRPILLSPQWTASG